MTKICELRMCRPDGANAPSNLRMRSSHSPKNNFILTQPSNYVMWAILKEAIFNICEHGKHIRKLQH